MAKGGGWAGGRHAMVPAMHSIWMGSAIWAGRNEYALQRMV